MKAGNDYAPGSYLEAQENEKRHAANLRTNKMFKALVSQAASTSQTSGVLIVGRLYKITTFTTGDNFLNVGAASNAVNVSFVATGTTPTAWVSSTLVHYPAPVATVLFNDLGGVATLAQNIANPALTDISSTGLFTVGKTVFNANNSPIGLREAIAINSIKINGNWVGVVDGWMEIQTYP